MIQNKKLLDALLRSDLASFIKRGFNIINPSIEFLDNWHIDLIADYLTLVEKGEINRLIINMPPRALKSVCISVAWPAWILGHHPSKRIIAASYAQSLSIRHSMDCKLLINSDWFQKLFPRMRISKSLNQKHKFLTTHNGFRFATSVGGAVTGDGGDFLIVDDPHKPHEVYSKKLRNKTIEWFEQTFATRLNNPKKGAIILVMQRLHPQDLCGHLLSNNDNNWHHLNIPAIHQQYSRYHFPSKKEHSLCKLTSDGYIVSANQLLHAARLDYKGLQQLKKQIGNDNFAAQYMQTPPVTKTGLLTKQSISFYKLLPSAPNLIIQSWDTAIKVSDSADFSVCSTWFVDQAHYYLVDIIRKKLSYPHLKNTAISHAKKYNPHYIIIEDKASGQSLIQDLKNQAMTNIIGQKVTTDKLVRFATTIPLFESGQIRFPQHAPWKEEVITELVEFPNSEHDDVVDSISQAINYLQYQYKKRPRPFIRDLSQKCY